MCWNLLDYCNMPILLSSDGGSLTLQTEYKACLFDLSLPANSRYLDSSQRLQVFPQDRYFDEVLHFELRDGASCL
jgi:hypothetical protein